MADRLNSLDVSFLCLEETTTPMHVGSVAIFQPPEEGFDYDRLVKLIKGRIALVLASGSVSDGFRRIGESGLGR